MTNTEFAAWVALHFSSRNAAAAYLDLDRDTVGALASGETRRGASYPVPHHIALACMAVARGIAIVPDQYASGAVTPAPGRHQTEQTRMIIDRADGTRTVREIADDLRINRKAVYAAIYAARRKGAAAHVKPDLATARRSEPHSREHA